MSELRYSFRLSKRNGDGDLIDRIEVASKTLGVSTSHLIRSAVRYALDHPQDLLEITR